MILKISAFGQTAEVSVRSIEAAMVPPEGPNIRFETTQAQDTLPTQWFDGRDFALKQHAVTLLFCLPSHAVKFEFVADDQPAPAAKPTEAPAIDPEGTTSEGQPAQ